jgi:hypothetical protein
VSSSALVVDAVVRAVPEHAGVFDIHVTDAHFEALRRRSAKRWGEGVMLTIRIEPKDEATKAWQFRHLYGHLFSPVSKETGETVADVAIRMKSQFMPDDGRTSLTELNEAELKNFTEAVEQDIRENDPKSWDGCLAAMALYDGRHA